jgi:Gluconate 2-dehydrogenase subunit 3
MSDIISTDNAFSDQHKQMLEILFDMMIPAQDNLPGAADPGISARALHGLGEDGPVVVHGLSALEALSSDRFQQPFTTLGIADRQVLIEAFKQMQPGFIQLMQLHVVSSYYQDDRVVTALGLEARPPHPGGYTMEEGNWTLLDPVRDRGRFYRDTTDENRQ